MTKGSLVTPLGDRLDRFCDSFKSVCDHLSLPYSSVSLHQLDSEDLQNLALDLVSVLRSVPDIRNLPSVNTRKSLLKPDDIIWTKIHAALVESTPPPKPLPILNQTPYLHTTSTVLKEELGPIYTGIRGFYEAYFGNIEGLEEAGAAVFRRSQEGDNPVFTKDGWRKWPESAKEKDVLDWLAPLVRDLRNLAVEEGFDLTADREVLTQPNRPLDGSTADQKLDTGIVYNSNSTNQTKYGWSQILVIGELKRNPKEDTTSKTWRDLGRYAREVLTAQDTRRFCLGFTLCGSVMRLWEFDRLGAIASSPFNINKDGLRFVSCILGFLRMDDVQLGHDPTIRSSPDGKRFVEIVRDGQPECLILKGILKRSVCVAGRATTCWIACRQGDKTNAPLVIKDSWQYPEREEEGKLLHQAAKKGAINVATYYYHETVHVNGKVNNIRDNVRKGLDMMQSTNYKTAHPDLPSDARDGVRIGRTGRSTSTAGRKRSSSNTGATLPCSKRPCSTSPSKGGSNTESQDRVHRRVIVSDYGTPIYKARTRVSLLSALENCIEGYESLHLKAGFLQGDISTSNLVLNDNEENPSWSAFLIDLDLAIQERRERPSGARGKTGTRAFMAIGLLLGEKHSFMHDLESFFWVILWICIHYDGPSVARVVPRFEKWNYVDMEELAELKKGAVAHEGDFISMVNDNFTEFYKPLVPWVNRLRKVVFPSGGRWEKESTELYSRMKDVLQAACKDPKVLCE
ncbi:protein kinase family protein [Aspergillus alliaceus]|uniref:protein kinase family protein n=1 Tax=Petromyces alliaceus TaxID=209559 RepID=UPI0012A5759A|nr:uncharacterized protein BDW43DRAFT_323447 [Aspergillus alliaceus]KAB8227915.1 hypothetical protein BDW43DRAFT_323447 [Aspergillus alliaceus]